MRAVPEALATDLASGVTTLAYIWRVERRDGKVFAFTDHDCPLPFDNLTATPMQSVSAGVIEKSVGLSADSASITGALSSAAITEDDLARGRWDSARVDLYRVNWIAPAQRVHVFAGRIGEVRRGAQAFEAELRGLQAGLNVPIGRVFSRFCDADLGDARCGVDLDTVDMCGEGEITEVLGTHAFKAVGLADFAETWFARGRIVWADETQSEIAVHRRDGDVAVLELIDPAPLEVGAVFTVFAGCDKRVETCRARFANVVNFRGFPHMPGNDALQAGPAAGERLDGGSRLR